MIRTYAYQLKPTKTQEHWLFEMLERLRDLQNSARNGRMAAYASEGITLSYADQGKELTRARARDDYYKDVPQDFQNHILRRVDKAFKAFFRRVRAGETPGFPRYRMQNKSLTWSLRKPKGVRENPIRDTDTRYDRLRVPKLGWVKIRMTRPLEGDPKEVTVVKKPSGWYVRIACELPDVPKQEPDTAIAVDMGTKHFLTDSDGDVADNPRFYRQAEGLQRKHQKDMARRHKGSHRRKKAAHTLARHHERTTNKRHDFISKLVYKLFHHKDRRVVVAEALTTSNMVKNKNLSKSIYDAAWTLFFQCCASIAERDGLHFHQVDPRNTSQTCSCCGQKSPKKLTLRDRRFQCGFCGLDMDRDHNAARNILIRAAGVLRGERWVTVLVEARSRELQKIWRWRSSKQTPLFDAMHTNPMPSGLGI